MGLIVFPTVIVATKDGKLLQVISGRTADYDHRLEVYCRRAFGEFDADELERCL